MSILIAPDSFKESLTAIEVAEIIEKGILEVMPKMETSKFPFSDGGEGAIAVLQQHVKGRMVKVNTFDPIFRPIQVSYFLFENEPTAWIELSSAAGLALLKKRHRNPLITSTYGVGIMIKDALEKGCTKIFLGVGGSATNDGGLGIYKALGGKILNKKGKELDPIGKNLSKINQIKNEGWSMKLADIDLIVAADVVNPLLGKKGATFVYGPQKGADPGDVALLEKGMRHWAQIISYQAGIDIGVLPGGGAAGGTAAGMAGLFRANIHSGFDTLYQLTDMEKKLKKCSLIITGEGKIDGQSKFGKLIYQLGSIGKKRNIPVICIAGGYEGDLNELYENGITSVFSIINQPMSLPTAIERAEKLLYQTTVNIMRGYQKSIKI
ncbi:MAG: glycerate kinase [Saprospiraceae bacterium]|jgi:glycerate kinase